MADPETILRSYNYADALRIRVCEKYLRAGAHWVQGKLKNVHIDYQENFNDEYLSITLTIKVSEVLAMKAAGKSRGH